MEVHGERNEMENMTRILRVYVSFCILKLSLKSILFKHADHQVDANLAVGRILQQQGF